VDLQTLIIGILAAVTVGGLFFAFVYPILSGEARTDQRIDALTLSSSQRRAGERIAEATNNRKKAVADSLKELDERENAKRRVNLEDKIERAGFNWSKQNFYMYSVIGGLGLAILIYVFFNNTIAAAMGLIVGGLGLPHWFLSYCYKKRVGKFVLEFPNAIDVIVRGIKSGLPLGDCLRIIAGESQEPLKSEFRAIVDAQTMGLTVGDACARLFKRMPIPEANFFVIVIQIQQKAGGNLAEALSNLSRVLRERKKMRAKIQAMSMEAKASGWIIGMLPFIVAAMVQAASPGFIAPLFNTNFGHMLLLGSAFWMICGVVVMKKMINFDI
jgi:tight adherence protein B